VLPTIRVQTLVLVDMDSFHEVPPETGRYVAGRIPGARVVEQSSEGGPHFHWYARGDAIVSEVGRFLAQARAVRCALAIVDAVRPFGLEVRAGVHTGEVETIGGKIGGLAVIIGARVAALASPSEVLTSQTVKDLVAGSGLTFEERGGHELKGVPGEWRVYAVSGG
jgi:hypothetical protein